MTPLACVPTCLLADVAFNISARSRPAGDDDHIVPPLGGELFHGGVAVHRPGLAKGEVRSKCPRRRRRHTSGLRRRHGDLGAIGRPAGPFGPPQCFPWCSRLGPRGAPGCYTACRLLHRVALICAEIRAKWWRSIGLRDRQKPRGGLELRPEGETPQALSTCAVRGGVGRSGASPTGLEPVTFGSGGRRSIRLSHGDQAQTCTD